MLTEKEKHQVSLFRGYLLEEALIYLIRNVGYIPIVSKEQDPDNIKERGHGLVIEGITGTEHQIDVIGELNWIPAFTFPIRLLLESKYTREKTDIKEIRNAKDILHEINQKSLIDYREGFFHKPIYHYVYAIASASGFTTPAMNHALRNQISLLDLSGEDYYRLKEAIEKSAKSLIQNIKNKNLISGFVTSFRHLFRNMMDLPLYFYNYKKINFDCDIENDIENSLNYMKNTLLDYNELFFGMINGPFIILMKAENSRLFLNYAIRKPSHDVSISWSSERDGGRTWTIKPKYDKNSYKLTFRLPDELFDRIFRANLTIDERRKAALTAKVRYFSTITIFHFDPYDLHNMRIFKLVFKLEDKKGLLKNKEIRDF